MNSHNKRDILPAFVHYSAAEDVGGVTTWLQDLLKFLGQRVSPPVFLTHYAVQAAPDYRSSSIYRELDGFSVEFEGNQFGHTTEDGIADVLQFINRVRPSVYLPHCLVDAHFAGVIAGRAGLPWVFTIHADYPEFWGIAKDAAPTAEEGVWVAVSEFIAQKARKEFPHALVRTIPYGTDIPADSCAFGDKPFTVVYCGRLVEYQKRMSLVLAVIKDVCQRSENIQFVMIGSGPESESFEREIAAAGLTSRVVMKGRLDPKTVKAEMLKCHAQLLMSDFEGLPVALIEGMSCGLVPVVRRIDSGIPELVLDKQTGLLVSEDPAECAAAIIDLAASREHWEKLSHAARHHIKSHYSIDRCHNAWLDLIHELSARCSCRYPIRVPRKLWLPPVNPDLKRLDQRRSAWSETLSRISRQSFHSFRGKLRKFLKKLMLR